jgi:Ca2+-binding RTX toxin-like protein
VVATFTDPNGATALSHYAASINWGDGTRSAGTITYNPTTKVFTVSGNHAYPWNSKYNIAVTITRDGTATATATTSVQTLTFAIEPIVGDPAALVFSGTPYSDNIKITKSGTNALLSISSSNAPTVVYTSTVPLASFNTILINGQAGNDTITIDPLITKNASIFAGSGNNTITGGGGNDLIVGGGGHNVIQGGGGRNVIIGGSGASTLQGGNGDDLLIAGSTAFDQNVSALEAIFAEWTSADTFAQRVANLSGTPQAGTADLNGLYFLTPATVTHASGKDTIKGSASRDWIFAHNSGTAPLDVLSGLSVNDVITSI